MTNAAIAAAARAEVLSMGLFRYEEIFSRATYEQAGIRIEKGEPNSSLSLMNRVVCDVGDEYSLDAAVFV